MVNKYPEWKKNLGLYRIEKLKRRYEIEGYKVTVFPVESNGLDMIVENEEEIIAIECINWNSKWKLSWNRLQNMINNWRKTERAYKEEGDKREFRAMLVYSYWENIRTVFRYMVEVYGPELDEIGEQDLPENDSWLGSEWIKEWVDKCKRPKEKNKSIEGWKE